MEKIGRHKYAILKKLKTLTVEQDKQVKAYEEEHGLSLGNKSQEEIEYAKKVFSTVKVVDVTWTYEELGKMFKNAWKSVTGKELEWTDEYTSGLVTVLKYFARDESFADGVTSLSEPSLDKGLLIIGDYGCGKSSMMRVIREILQYYPGYAFKTFSANEVVDMFEKCSDPQDKKDFWKQMITGRCHFDDVKSEREASNYGKMELFKDLIEKRYDARVKTYFTCNYPDNAPGNLEAGIDEFGIKYGPRVYDRIPEMFNIIEFRGKSFRK